MSDLGYNLRCVIDVHILAGLSQSDPHVCISYDHMFEGGKKKKKKRERERERERETGKTVCAGCFCTSCTL